MNTKDTLSAVFMFLTIASFIAFASMLQSIDGKLGSIDDNTYCGAYPNDTYCADSMNISAPTLSDGVLTNY